MADPSRGLGDPPPSQASGQTFAHRSGREERKFLRYAHAALTSVTEEPACFLALVAHWRTQGRWGCAAPPRCLLVLQESLIDQKVKQKKEETPTQSGRGKAPPDTGRAHIRPGRAWGTWWANGGHRPTPAPVPRSAHGKVKPPPGPSAETPGGCGCPRARQGAQAGHSPPHLLSGVQGSIHTGYGQRHASRGARRPRPAPLLRCAPRHAHEACGTQPSSVQTSVGCPGAAPSGSAPARRRRWPLWGAGRRQPGGTGSFTPLPHCSYPSCSGCGGEPTWSKLTLVWHRTRRGGSWGAAAPGSYGSTTWRSQRAAVGCRFACSIGILRVRAVPPSILRWPGDPQSVGFLLPAAFWPACKRSTPKSSPKCTTKHIDPAVYIPISKRNQERSPYPINYAYLIFIRRDCPRSAPFQAGGE